MLIGNFRVLGAFSLVSSTSIEGNAMARRGRPPVTITLTGAERRQLESWAGRHSSAQNLALRCKIILLCEDSTLTGKQIAAKVGCNPATVSKWRKRFAAQRLDGLADEPRPGAARSIGDDVIEQVVIDTLETAPADATHWSTRGLAAKHGISHETVSQIWKAFGLKPWRQDEFKISPDPQLVDKIRDLVGLYLNPPVHAAVFAVDEKPQIQALNRTAPTLPMLPTTPARATHDYQRNGTIDLFAALNIATGTVITDLRPNHTSAQFIKFLNKINRNAPAEPLDIDPVVHYLDHDNALDGSQLQRPAQGVQLGDVDQRPGANEHTDQITDLPRDHLRAAGETQLVTINDRAIVPPGKLERPPLPRLARTEPQRDTPTSQHQLPSVVIARVQITRRQHHHLDAAQVVQHRHLEGLANRDLRLDLRHHDGASPLPSGSPRPAAGDPTLPISDRASFGSW